MIDLAGIYKIAEKAAQAAGSSVRQQLGLDAQDPDKPFDPERYEAGVEAMIMTAVVFLAGVYPVLPPEHIKEVTDYIVRESLVLFKSANAPRKAEGKIITPTQGGSNA